MLQESESDTQSPLLETPQTMVTAVSASDDIEKQEPVDSKLSEQVSHTESNRNASAHNWRQSVMSKIARMDFTGSCHAHTVINVIQCNSVSKHT
jgi:hypothetical protein